MDMTNTASEYQRLRASLAAAGQEHVFAYWESLGDAERGLLLEDLRRINLSELPLLAMIASGRGAEDRADQELEPPPITPRSIVSAKTISHGREWLSAGKVAAFTVAGGQGTRLGFDGPKGALPISPIRAKPLFQLFAESILAARRRCQSPIPWYIMTSPTNDEATRSFFRERANFGLPSNDVVFFQQGVMPAFSRTGQILLDERHRIALSPDGHGGSLLALASTGMLADMARRGVEHISYFQVDNPLVACLDPVFIGLHDETGSEMSSKALPKADDLERVGNLVLSRGRLTVFEYSDLSEQLARARNPDGTRRFDAANIAVHILSRAFVERLTSNRAAFGLPWHRAEKKVPYVDVATGRRIEPTAPNSIKLESFVFDALPLAKKTLVLGTVREEEFSPVKNASGIDSIETAKRDMGRRAARWLEKAGWQIPRKADGEPDGWFEISPLLAADAGELIERCLPARRLEPGAHFYLE